MPSQVGEVTKPGGSGEKLKSISIQVHMLFLFDETAAKLFSIPSFALFLVGTGRRKVAAHTDFSDESGRIMDRA